MDKRALNTLEYNKIIERLAQRAISTRGKARCEGLLPSADFEEISRGLLETEQALDFRMKAGSLPLGGIRDIEPSLKRADMGGVLNIEELYHIGEFIYVCRKVLSYSKSVEKRDYLEIIDGAFERIETAVGLEREISRCVVNERDLADDASAELASIRRSIKISGGRVNDALNSIIHSQAYKNMLQDAVITMRGGRFCVPIKQEYRNSFPGMVHDVSGSGATVFIEPMSVVELNNKIKELEAREKEEIQRILVRLTYDVAAHSPVLYENFKALTDLDFYFAKAELALAMNATLPLFNDSGIVNIKKGRHPLLNVENVVPTDIYLGEDFYTLLITGPNTGGKTVALKTLGLFQLMGAAGLFIPAAGGSRLAVFDSVFADIGDEQSIEQSLSTFSAHMTNIVRILQEMTFNSLVLFDELGAGTDPTEGAALGIAIIRHLLDRGIRCAVTTHYSELKIFALSTDCVENAAVEFDIETLRPTFRLLIGVPGKSNAFAIAGRLGLPNDIIQSAREVLTSENIRFEDVITDLEMSKKAVEIEQERAAAYRREAEGLKGELEKQKARLELNRERTMEEARSQARNLVQKAKGQADGIIKEMQRLQAEGITFKEAEEMRRQLADSVAELAPTEVRGQGSEVREVDRPLVVGDEVVIVSIGQRGVVKSVNAAGNEFLVRFGAVEMKVGISQLALPLKEVRGQRSEVRKGPVVQTSGTRAAKALSVSGRLDLRGCMVEEALERLTKYLDDVYLAGMGKVEIIHGKGTGALRAAVQKHLKGHPYVKNHRLGEFGEGDAGVTIAEIK